MIPVNEPIMPSRAREYLIECIDTGWISAQGRFVRLFEEAFAEYLGVKHAITTTSGTTALHLALAALGIGSGDEVIIPTLTMVATANAVVYTGAQLVLVDSEPLTGNLDVNQVEEKISPRTKAILPVHLYGHPVDMGPLMEVAERHGVHVVEDAAEAHGAEYQGRKAGTLGHIGCFSFYANKIITTGEGGMLVTDDDHLARRARGLKDLAHSPNRRFLHEEVGFNYRMTNLQAAVGLAGIEEIDSYLCKKEQMAAQYTEGLKAVAGLDLPYTKPEIRNVYWMYAIRLNASFPLGRDGFCEALRNRGVDTRTFFIPMHRQPALEEWIVGADGKFPIAENLGASGLYLPSGLAITDQQIDSVCEVVREIAEEGD